MLENSFIDIGEIELGLLAEKFQLNFTIQRWGKPKNIFFKTTLVKNITLYNQLNLQPNAKASWSLELPNVAVTDLRDYDGYLKIRRCYQFLDKIFDNSIFNLGYECNDKFQDVKILSNGDYIDFNTKKTFFVKFREKFNDEQSQIYGWRGLINWVIKKDIEARNNRLGDGLNHTMQEFQIIADILEHCQGVRKFAELTSIYITNDDQKVAEQLIDITIADFTYRTQRALREKRYTHARYIEYARDPAKFILLFNSSVLKV